MPARGNSVHELTEVNEIMAVSEGAKINGAEKGTESTMEGLLIVRCLNLMLKNSKTPLKIFMKGKI